MIGEVWKLTDNPGYSVSSLGRVRSEARIVNRGKYSVNWPEKILKPRLHSGGYMRVSLGFGVDRYIHRLVATAFLENPTGLPEVNHKDCDKTNNSLENLEWISAVKNMEHAAKTVNPTAKMFEVFDLEGNLVYDGLYIHELKNLGFTGSSVHKVANGELKTHKGHTFKRRV